MGYLLVRMEDSKAVVDVGAEICINVVRGVLALALPVPCPVGEVAHHL